MTTLTTVFSGVAALMCLLVGFQLLFLESRLVQAVANGPTDPDLPIGQWKMLTHTAAVMSFGAGILIFLFGLRQWTAAGSADRNRAPNREIDTPDIDPGSISVRIFEVDALDNSVEITLDRRDRLVRTTKAGSDLSTAPDRRIPGPGPEGETGGDPADSIVNSIRETAGRTFGSPPGNRRPSSFWHHILGRRRPR